VNSYEEFKADFLKENRKLKIIIGVMIIVFGLGTSSLILQKKYFLYKGKDIFEERPLAVEVCRLGFMTLVDGEPNHHVVTKGIIDLVKKEPFTITVDKVLQLKSIEAGACKIVFQSDKKLVAFKIILESSDDFPFFYKLNELVELSADEEVL
jgi:hypothetical protein